MITIWILLPDTCGNQIHQGYWPRAAERGSNGSKYHATTLS